MFDLGFEVIDTQKRVICTTHNLFTARKIARALNAMEDKPKPLKSKRFVFDWSGIDPKYKWAAMDSDGEWIVCVDIPETAYNYWENLGRDCIEFGNERPPYPGDWRDSLQKRP